MDGALHLGSMRHYYAQEDIFFMLKKKTDPNLPFTGGTLALASVKATIVFPDGSVKEKHTSPPAGTFTELGGGAYSLALWGEGQSAGVNDVDLAQVGRCAILIEPGTGNPDFATILLTYEVQPDFDCDLQCVTTGPAGAEMLTGVLTFSRWRPREHFPLAKTAMAGLQVAITDSGVLSVTIIESDMTEGSDGNVYFTKSIVGITGARALTARVTGTYKGFDFTKDFSLYDPLAA